MLKFYSASTRSVNSKRAILECLEAAMGDNYADIDLLIFNASIGHNFDDILSQTHILAPNARVVGASCCGIVGREGVSETMKDIAIMAVKGKEFSISSVNDIYGHNSYEKAHEMALELYSQNPNTSMVYFLASGIDIANDLCIKAFVDVFGEDITIFGATSSDNMKGLISFQAIDNNVYEHGAFAIAFNDPTLSIYTQATHGFVAIGDPLLVTKSTGNIIEELNNRPAWTVYTERLGLEKTADCADTIPIGALGEKLSIEDAKGYGNQCILRAVTKHDGDKMYYTTICPIGTELYLTTRDEDLIFSDMDRVVSELKHEIGDKTPVAIFHADCLARGRFMVNRIVKEELVDKMQKPFYSNNECPPWIGMYGFGEFAKLSGRNEYHNYTTALYVICR
jgi:hypothetical protein